MAAKYLTIPDLDGVEIVRENTRRYLALISIVGFFVILTLILVVGWIVRGVQVDDVVNMMTTTSGVLAGVVGAIVGFYFRTED